ncbi:MAG: hypothetical protein PHE52_00455 [Candidatus Pacebacteria bacterium]|nr:hypothetical protein [Candidatus Paceibacterota bacterium]
MFKKFFNEFDFIGFHAFGFDLVDNYGLHQIRFNPDHPESFSQHQLTHLGRDINDHGSFIWAWRQKTDVVRKVSFDQFSNDLTRKITMTINLDEKFISLNKEEGISSIEIENILKNNMVINLGKNVDEGKSKFVAVKVNGIMENSVLEDNITGPRVGLLEADGLKNSSIKGNKVSLSPFINKIEIIKGDKIEQHGDKNEAQIKNVKNTDSKKWLSFSMDNPVIWVIASLIVSAVVYFFFTK